MTKKSAAEKKETPRKTRGSYTWTDKKTGLLYARVRVRLPNGKLKPIYRRAKNITHAKQIAEEIFDEYASRGEAFIEGRELTFAQSAKWYKEKYLVPPVYNSVGQKVGGLRSWEAEKRKVDRLIKFFSQTKITEFTEKTLEFFVEERKKGKVKQATINRDLETLRAMFKKFKRKRWISESPFEYGEPLIIKALEDRRAVTLTDEQETAILHFAKESQQTLIYPLVLVLRDSGARPSEIYPVNEKKDSGVIYKPVVWQDFFDFNFKAVRLTSYKGKQVKVRFAPVTTRVKNALLELWNSLPEDKRQEQSLIFPHKSYKTSWGKVRASADIALKIAEFKEISVMSVFDGTLSEQEIEKLTQKFKKEKPVLDVRLRDLRRDFRVRLARAGYSDQLAQRLLGHESADTTYIYTEADLQAVYLANDALNQQNESEPTIKLAARN